MYAPFRAICQKRLNLGSPNLVDMMIKRHPGFWFISGPKDQSSEFKVISHIFKRARYTKTLEGLLLLPLRSVTALVICAKEVMFSPVSLCSFACLLFVC